MAVKCYECEYCKNKFKKETYLTKHQKNAKYCLSIQKENKYKQKILKEVEIEVVQSDIISDLEKKKINDIHETFLEFENSKLELEDEYNTNISNILEKQNLKNNIEEYYSIEKSKIDKLQELYALFEKNKILIEEKYQNLILEENKNWKDDLKKEKFKELESSFDLIKNKINNLIDTSEDIDKAQDTLNQFIFNLNEHLVFNENEVVTEGVTEGTNEVISEGVTEGDSEVVTEGANEGVSEGVTEGDSEVVTEGVSEGVSDYNPPNNDLENKLLYHLIVLLQEQKLSKDNLLYIIVELMKYINNFDVKGTDKKSFILYILRNFIDTNEDDIENKEDMKRFLTIFSNDFVDIVSAISDKKLRIKIKKSCFFPLCF
jgi:hypothetical protein